MNVQHVNVKFFVENPEAVSLDDFVGLFNGWIQAQDTEELLVDVADYRHVFAGPGVVLIGHEANYSLDKAGNRLGLLYNRKAWANGEVEDRLLRAVRSALRACHRIETEARLQSKPKFSGQEVQLVINDRLLAPDREAMFSALAPELRQLFHRLFAGAEYTLERDSRPRERFNVTARAEAPFDVETLLKNLG